MDEVSREIIVNIVDQILPTIVNIVNFYLQNGGFFIITLSKTSFHVQLNNLRPIFILFLSKILEFAFNLQVSSFIFSSFQSGFRTTTALVGHGEAVGY